MTWFRCCSTVAPSSCIGGKVFGEVCELCCPGVFSGWGGVEFCANETTPPIRASATLATVDLTVRRKRAVGRYLIVSGILLQVREITPISQMAGWGIECSMQIQKTLTRFQL